MQYELLTDAALVSIYIKGDESALETLINRHKQKIYSFIYSKILDRDLAEDVFQDTFIKVIKSLKRGKYKDNGRFLSWVLRIAHNLVIDHYRKEKQLQTVSNDNYETDIFNSQQFSDKTIEDKMVNRQITNEVRNLIKQLPEDQREVVILRHYCELSFKEIAEYTDVSINTALGRMRYALINLRRSIEEKQLNLNLV